MKFQIAILSVCLAATQAVKGAVTISLTENLTTGPVFQNSTGGVILDGRLVRIGMFTGGDPSPNATFDTLAATFVEFNTTTFGNATVTNADDNKGRISRSNIADGAAPPAASAFVNQKIFIWVYDSATASPLVDQGVFSSSTNILFADALSATSVSMLKMDQAFGKFAGAAVGATTTLIPNQTTGGILNLAGPVPEASTAAMFFIGLVGMIYRRRR